MVLLLTGKRFDTLFWCFRLTRISKCRLGTCICCNKNVVCFMNIPLMMIIYFKSSDFFSVPEIMCNNSIIKNPTKACERFKNVWQAEACNFIKNETLAQLFSRYQERFYYKALLGDCFWSYNISKKICFSRKRNPLPECVNFFTAFIGSNKASV